MARYLTEEEINNKKEREVKKLLEYITSLSFNFGLPKVEFLDPRVREEVKDIFHSSMEDIEKKIREAYNFPKEEGGEDAEVNPEEEHDFGINECEWY